MSRAPAISTLQQSAAEYMDALDAETVTAALGSLSRQLQATRAQLDAAAIASIHSAALPVHTPRIWTCGIDGVGATVVPLEAKYAPPEMAASMIGPTRDACGCGCEYVGCVVYGNAFGLRLTPCPTHISATRPVVHSFLTSSVSPPFPNALPSQSPASPHSASVPSIPAGADTPRSDPPTLGPRPIRIRRVWPPISPRTPLQELRPAPMDSSPVFTDPRSLLIDMLQHAASLSCRVDELNHDVVGLVNGVRIQSELLASPPGATDAAGAIIFHPAGTVTREPLPAGATMRVLRVGAGLPAGGGVEADLPWDVIFG
ncbi:hypothetical protein FB451DRAFT_1360185 [Mycena latifolia]|nr:hypothetical protein FB451DRAFT_1360185 [Mycena latifolia]